MWGHRCRKPEAGQISEDEGKPRAPDGKFEHHHEEQFKADTGMHSWKIEDRRRKLGERKICSGKKKAARTIEPPFNYNQNRKQTANKDCHICRMRAIREGHGINPGE